MKRVSLERMRRTLVRPNFKFSLVPESGVGILRSPSYAYYHRENIMVEYICGLTTRETSLTVNHDGKKYSCSVRRNRKKEEELAEVYFRGPRTWISHTVVGTMDVSVDDSKFSTTEFILEEVRRDPSDPTFLGIAVIDVPLLTGSDERDRVVNQEMRIILDALRGK